MRSPHRTAAEFVAETDTERPGRFKAQAGMTLLEVLVSIAMMVLIVSSMSILVGAATRSKLIVNVRSADTATVRQTLEWMSERLRNAGLNVNPTDPAQAAYPLRCRDRVVAQDASLLPTASQVYVSGEILNSDTLAGNELMTVGYFVGTVGSNQVVMEYRYPCVGGAPATTQLSDPRINVLGLTFQYFSANGNEVTNLTSAADIRRIQMIRVTLAVQGSEGTSGPHQVSVTRNVMFRNPEPYANSWTNPTEVIPP
ncbi:MAG: type II secretion system protein [Armatimonadota bacterium]|nr:type II secretion system protein [Armatimonadota bacterium]